MAKAWTLMLYMAGDNDMAEPAKAKLEELRRIGSNEFADVVVQYDLGEPRVMREHVGGAEAPSPARETNSGDKKTLINFVAFARQFRANRKVLVIYNHGFGLDADPMQPHGDHAVAHGLAKTAAQARPLTHLQKARAELAELAPYIGGRLFPKAALRRIRADRKASQSAETNVVAMAARESIPATVPTTALAFDATTGDFLDNIELKAAITAATRVGRGQQEPFDILGMEACLMNTFEIAYQLRKVAKFVIGSQSKIPQEGWPYAAIIPMLHARFATAAVSRKIVNEGVGRIGPHEHTTVSAFDMARAHDVAKAISRLAVAMTKALDEQRNVTAIALAHHSAQSFAASETVDLVDFCRQLTSRIDDPDILEAAFALECEIGSFVVESQTRGFVVSNAHGVSIYFPKRKYITRAYRALDFARGSQWVSFLEAYLEKLFPNAEVAADNATPSCSAEHHDHGGIGAGVIGESSAAQKQM